VRWNKRLSLLRGRMLITCPAGAGQSRGDARSKEGGEMTLPNARERRPDIRDG
jgi:hypothetical protein